MPTADASLLLPPPNDYADAEEEGSSRSLDHVGVEAVLEAMIVQRRTSSHNLRQSAPSFSLERDAHAHAHASFEPAEIDPEALQDDEEEEEDEITSPDTFAARERVRTSEVFLKVR